VSISGELKQQITGVLELSAEARDSVDEAAELLDSAVARLTSVLAASNDPGAAEAVRALALAHEHLTEVSGLFGWVAGELPIYLERLGQAPSARAADAPAVEATRGRRGKMVTSVARPGGHADPVTEERTFMAWWGTKSREIPDAGTAESVISEAADRFFTATVRGIAIRLGDGEREQAPLRIDIDASVGRAAVSWHGAPGVEHGVDPDRPLIVEDDPKQPPATIPADRARVTRWTAISAAREYIETGRRPTCLEWNSDPAGEDAQEKPGEPGDGRRDRARSTGDRETAGWNT
jgi:hypothetical protein